MQNKSNRYVTNNDMVIQLYKNFGVYSSIWCVLSYTKGWHTKPVSWKDRSQMMASSFCQADD
jgi:hypothetical protein